MAKLILVRHGLTDWNKIGKWHGLTDIPLNEEGREEARHSAQALKGLKIDTAYTSNLSRTKQTYQVIGDQLKLACPVHHSPELNERDYGIYTGQNKWQVKEKLGEEKFNALRRGWDVPIPQGESLKD